jgi:hypothetical protein
VLGAVLRSWAAVSWAPSVWGMSKFHVLADRRPQDPLDEGVLWAAMDAEWSVFGRLWISFAWQLMALAADVRKTLGLSKNF